MKKIKVTVWNEYTLEKTETEAMAILHYGDEAIFDRFAKRRIVSFQ